LIHFYKRLDLFNKTEGEDSLRTLILIYCNQTEL